MESNTWEDARDLEDMIVSPQMDEVKQEDNEEHAAHHRHHPVPSHDGHASTSSASTCKAIEAHEEGANASPGMGNDFAQRQGDDVMGEEDHAPLPVGEAEQQFQQADYHQAAGPFYPDGACPLAPSHGIPDHVFQQTQHLTVAMPITLNGLSGEPKFIGVRKSRGGKYSARIKIGGANKYIGTYDSAVEAAYAFDVAAVKSGRPVETLNFPATHGGPAIGQAYRKRKQNLLYEDPRNHINVLLRKLSDVDRSNPGIIRMTMGTLGVPSERFEGDRKYSGVRKQANHYEARIRYQDKLYSMGFYSSQEAAALAWDISAASLRRCGRLNFPEISFAELEQQLDALKCVMNAPIANGERAYLPIAADAEILSGPPAAAYPLAPIHPLHGSVSTDALPAAPAPFETEADFPGQELSTGIGGGAAISDIAHAMHTGLQGGAAVQSPQHLDPLQLQASA